MAPAWVEGAEPAKELAVLGNATSEALIHVVVGVDHARDDHAIEERDDTPLCSVLVGDAFHGANPLNDVSTDKDCGIVNLSKVFVKGSQSLDVGVEHCLSRDWAWGAPSFNGHDRSASTYGDAWCAIAPQVSRGSRVVSHSHAARRYATPLPSDAHASSTRNDQARCGI